MDRLRRLGLYQLGFLIPLLGWLGGCLVESGAPELADTEQALLPITPEDQIERAVQDAFNQAACYCEAYLLDTVYEESGSRSLWGSNDSCWGDPRMSAFNAANRNSDGTVRACTLSNAYPQGTLKPERWTDPDYDPEEEFARNGCMNPVQLLDAPGGDDVGPPNPVPGFCRADVNYCIAQQLVLEANSLARAQHRPVREKILAEARLRFGMSANEHATMLEWVDEHKDDACRAPNWCTRPKQVGPRTYQTISSTRSCERVCTDTSLGKLATARAIDDINIGPGRPICRTVCTGKTAAQVESECESARSSRESYLRSRGYSNPVVTKRVTRDHRNDQERTSCTITESYGEWESYQCGCPERDVSKREQLRLSRGYDDVVIGRIADAVSQMGLVVEEEVRSAMARSDQITPATASGSYASAIWGSGSPRMQGVASVAGQGAIVTSDVPAGEAVLLDDMAMFALDLLLDHHVTLPIRACDDGTFSWDTPSGAAFEAKVDAAHEALALAFANGDPAISDVELNLLTETGIARQHVQGAIRLAKDRTLALDADFTVERPAGATCGYGALVFNGSLLSQQSVVPVLSAGAQAGEGYPDYSPTITRAISCTNPDWYSGHRTQLSKVGAAGAIQSVRHRMQRLFTDGKIENWRAREDVAQLDRLIAGLIGQSWTDYRLVATSGTWKWFNAQDFDPATDSVLVTSRKEDVYCLMHGHYPGAAQGTGCPGSSVQTKSLSTALVLGSVQVKQFDVSTPAPERLYVLRKDCAAGGACKHTLLDVIYPAKAGSAHAIGGELGDHVARLLAKSSDKPVEPMFNALGLPTNLVPPLSHPLIGQRDADGNEISEAYAAYWEEAMRSAQLAIVELSEARQLELDYLSFTHLVTGEADKAEMAQKELVGAACGSSDPSSTCAVARRDVTLAELGLVSSPTGANAEATLTMCSDFLRTFSFSPPSSDIKAYTEQKLGTLLDCTSFVTLYSAARIKLDQLPVPVIDRVRANLPPSYAEVGGQMRTQLIALHTQLDELRSALREFQTLSTVARQKLNLMLDEIDEEEPSFWDKWSCRIREGAKIVAGVASAAAGVAAIVAGAPTGVGAAAAVAFYASNAGDAANGVVGVIDGINAIKECGSTDDAQDAATKAYIETLEASSQMQVLLDTAMRLIAIAATADTELDNLVRAAQLAQERADLERRILAGSIQGDPAWRALQGKKMENARRRMFYAQQMSFIARRAMETRIAGDLTVLDTATSLGTAPAFWIDDIFVLDGEVVSDGAGHTISAAPEAIASYLEDLRGFTFGYALDNPARRGTDRTYLSFARMLDAETADGLIDLEKVWFKCASGSEFIEGGLVNEDDVGPCSAPSDNVREVKVQFMVPAGLSSYLQSRMAAGNANYRVLHLGLNVDGVDRICSGNDPECISDQTVRYSVRHDGATLLEGLSGERRFFDFGAGVIRNARALMVNTFLPDPTFATDMEALMRTELRGRPLAGRWTVTIDTQNRPMTWDMLEDLQFVLDYEYWTAQQ